MFTHTNPFIIDNGTLNFKSGYSNCTKPIYSSNHSKSFYHFQDQIIHQKCTVLEAGRIQDLDQLEYNYKHLFCKEFGENFYDDFMPPILILDSINVNEKAKKKFIQILFEQFNLEVIGFASQVTMELFATGNTTGLVVDSGFGHTQIAPIVEGVILKHNQISENISGREINQQLISLLEKRGFKLEQILPKLKSIKKNSKGFILNDDLECYNNGLINTEIFKQSSYSYQMLPDENKIQFQDIDFGFTSLLLNYIFFNPELKGSQNESIQNLVLKSLKLYPYELSKLLCKNTVLGGGNTLIKNYQQKLSLELSNIEPSLQFNFVNYDYSPEYLAWKGGQIISELPNSNCYWITKTEYFEQGQSLIDRKLQNSPNFLQIINKLINEVLGQIHQHKNFEWLKVMQFQYLQILQLQKPNNPILTLVLSHKPYLINLLLLSQALPMNHINLLRESHDKLNKPIKHHKLLLYQYRFYGQLIKDDHQFQLLLFFKFCPCL